LDWVREALTLARVTKKDVIYDLGSGDGRVVGLAVRSFGARKGVGVEIVEQLVEQARQEWPEATFIRADFRDVDISDATMVFVWIGSATGYDEAWKHIARWCKPGTRVLMPRGRPAPAGFKLLRSSEHFDLWELRKWAASLRPRLLCRFRMIGDTRLQCHHAEP
jgi:ubiquinone/menaquinone biosynthesis C-methylase UbiE